jgi:hypothetical protein
MGSSEKSGNVSLAEYVNALDQELGGMDEDAVEALFEKFARVTQPRLMELFSAIAEQNEIPEFFLAESAFHLYSLQRFHEDILPEPPGRISRRRLLGALDVIEQVVDGIPSAVDLKNDSLTAAEVPFFAHDVPRLFFHRWRGELQEMLDHGEISEEIYWDLFRFYLTVLKIYSDEFPAARVDP